MTLAILARAHSEAGHTEKSLEILAQGRLEDPTYVPLSISAIEILFASHRWADAVNLANEGLQHRPSDVSLIVNRAVALVELGRLDEAEKDLNDVVLTAKSPGFIYGLLGRIHLDRDEEDQAADALRNAYLSNYRPDWLVQALETFNAVPERWENLFRAKLPSDFVLVHSKENETEAIFQFVPSGEDLRDWTRMITLHASLLRNNIPDAHQIMANQLAKEFTKDCTSSATNMEPEFKIRSFINESATRTVATVLALQNVPGATTAWCNGFTGRSDATPFKVRKNSVLLATAFQNRRILYSIQFEWQSDDVESEAFLESVRYREIAEPFMMTARPNGWP